MDGLKVDGYSIPLIPIVNGSDDWFDFAMPYSAVLRGATPIVQKPGDDETYTIYGSTLRVWSTLTRYNEVYSVLRVNLRYNNGNTSYNEVLVYTDIEIYYWIYGVYTENEAFVFAVEFPLGEYTVNFSPSVSHGGTYNGAIRTFGFSSSPYIQAPLGTTFGEMVANGTDHIVLNYDSASGELNLDVASVSSNNGYRYFGGYNLLSWYNSNKEDVQIPGDPFAPGGTSDVGGGGGAFDDTSDVIADSALPTLSAANTGFTRIYNPTLSQVQALANYLWTDTTVIDTIWNHIKQFLEDPMDAFIAFNLVPCSVPDGGTQEFKVMYVPTGVMMTVAANQFVDIDCGTLAIENYYGSALDYAPYTKISVFLPYIGTVPLDCDEVMGKTLTVKYRIDIVSGACVAKIAVDGNYIYQYSGHCAINIPFTSADFTGYVAAIIQAARAAGAIAGGAGAAIAAATPAPEQQTGRMTASHTRRETERNPKSGRQITMSTVTDTWMRYDEPEQKMTAGSFAGLVAGQVSNTVGAVANSKPVVEHSGSFSGNSGYLGVRRPFAIIERPRMCNPSEYGVLNGYPSMLYRKLGDLSGFTQVQQIQLTGMTCTNPELAEIYTLLKSGVII